MGESIAEQSTVSRLRLDLAMNAFQVHAAGAAGEAVVIDGGRRGRPFAVRRGA
jgi:hypothetical protein